MGTIKVLIADDHSVVRMGLASLLGTAKDIEIVGEAIDGVDAVRKAFEKLGDTDFRLETLEVDDPEGLFVPASVLNSLRRKLVEAVK